MRGMMMLAIPAMMWLAGCGGKGDCTCDACETAIESCADDATCEDAAVALCGTGETGAE